MLYCSNPQCSAPFNSDDAKTCLNCGCQSLAPIFHHRYKVIKILGEGGFARTYKALDIEQMNHPCVIKQLIVREPDFLEKAKELFQQEAKRLYDLGKHQQIPSLLAHFEENNKLYLVQEYIQGKDLYTEFKEQGKFDENKIRQLLKSFLPVLQFIHEHKIIHRDIKPQNIMRRDSSDELVLIDFGIAKKLANTGVYAPGTIIGTPGYAPVEQIAYGKVSPASDLYSLGITCIRLLTGNFLNIDLEAPLSDSTKKSWTWREDLPNNFEEKLANLLDKLIDKEVRNRYQSASNVLKDLEDVKPVQNSGGKMRNIRNIRTIDNNREVSGIILKEANHKELVQIAKVSVPIIEERLEDKKISNGSSFLYKQVIFTEKKQSRCYFLTNLHVITGILNWDKHLTKVAQSGRNIENIKLGFVAVWNQKEYRINKFLIPKNTLSEILNNPHCQHLDFALFHLDIDTTEILDFFGLASQSNLELGDKIYAFGYPQGLNLSLADGIVSHIYKHYQERVDNPITKGAIQHNILINPGNSGGPTVNEFGEIAGISTRGYSSSVAVGLNFSLNIRPILEQLKDSNNFEMFTVSEHLQEVKQRIC